MTGNSNSKLESIAYEISDVTASFFYSNHDTEYWNNSFY